MGAITLPTVHPTLLLRSRANQANYQPQHAMTGRTLIHLAARFGGIARTEVIFVFFISPHISLLSPSLYFSDLLSCALSPLEIFGRCLVGRFSSSCRISALEASILVFEAQSKFDQRL